MSKRSDKIFRDNEKEDDDWIIPALKAKYKASLSKNKKRSWPRSLDNLYSPSREAVRQLIRVGREEKRQERARLKDPNRKLSFEEKLELDRERRWKLWVEEGIDEGPIPVGQAFWEEHWDMIKNKRDYSNYLKRLKRRQKKEYRANAIFKISREKAKNYYIFQKKKSIAYSKDWLLKLFSFLQHSLKKKQMRESFYLLLSLQEERYTLGLFYEDYILPLGSKRKVKMNPLLHENYFKKQFLTKLYEQQSFTYLSFLRKQHSERLLHFLWCLKRLEFLYKEKRDLSIWHYPTPNDFFDRNRRKPRWIIPNLATYALRSANTI